MRKQLQEASARFGWGQEAMVSCWIGHFLSLLTEEEFIGVEGRIRDDMEEIDVQSEFSCWRSKQLGINKCAEEARFIKYRKNLYKIRMGAVKWHISYTPRSATFRAWAPGLEESVYEADSLQQILQTILCPPYEAQLELAAEACRSSLEAVSAAAHAAAALLLSISEDQLFISQHHTPLLNLQKWDLCVAFQHKAISLGLVLQWCHIIKKPPKCILEVHVSQFPVDPQLARLLHINTHQPILLEFDAYGSYLGLHPKAKVTQGGIEIKYFLPYVVEHEMKKRKDSSNIWVELLCRFVYYVSNFGSICPICFTENFRFESQDCGSTKCEATFMCWKEVLENNVAGDTLAS